jgi:hypothetical protein
MDALHYSGIRWIDYRIGKRALTPALSHRMGEGEASRGLSSILRPSQYEVENKLLSLIRSLEAKRSDGSWDGTLPAPHHAGSIIHHP